MNADRAEFMPRIWLRNSHLQTILPAFFRRVEGTIPRRERLELPDGDFLDLDWFGSGGRDLAILSHGLEGNSRRPYILGMARALSPLGVDSLAWNYRSCGGEPNRLPRLYSQNDTDDLHCVVQHGIAAGYERILLIGFSMGGNVSLLYPGRLGAELLPQVAGVVGISATVDLADAAAQMARPVNRLYMKHFLVQLHERIRSKMARFPECLDDNGYNRIHDFKAFDDRYTAPLHGFRDARHYWLECSSAPLLTNIKPPCLLLNAADDPFLGPHCYPVETGSIRVKIPRFGGHLGFIIDGINGTYWSEMQTAAFVREVLR
jgi:predicted alpha/beta-fold hydrolase